MTDTAAKPPIDTRAYRTSWRLDFRFDGERVDLVRRTRLQKVSAGTTSLRPAAGKSSGAWLELVDRSGNLLFHRLLHDPLQTRAEHHSPDGRIELHVRPPEPCEFTAIVPDIPGASEVVLFASPTDQERLQEAASELGRFALRDDRTPGADGGELKS